MEQMELRETLGSKEKMEKMAQEVYQGQQVHQERGDLEEHEVPQVHLDQLENQEKEGKDKLKVAPKGKAAADDDK